MVHRAKTKNLGFRCHDLNTSYVMVHHKKMQSEQIQNWIFKYILCYGSSTVLKTTKISNSEFKYILCYGSSQR